MKVVVSTPDVVGTRMAGPGIRAFHFADELAKHFDTTLVAKLEDAPPRAPFAIVPRSADVFRAADVVISQSARDLRFVRREQRFVADLFDPQVLELRELYGRAPSARQRIHVAAEWWRLTRALRRADLLVCATAAQRRFYDQLRQTDASWIEVPFGVEDDGGSGVAEDDLLIWGGGTWEWLDPAIAVDAIVKCNAEGVRCRLLFLGRSRPNRDLIDRRREDRFDRLLERGQGHVSANETWVPYADRLSWLRRGKAAIMLHRPTAEAQYSIRTRLFDAIAAAIPVIATREGYAAELVERERLGIVVPAGDVDAVADAVRRLLRDDVLHAECVRNLERIRPRFAWDVVTRPLVEAVSRWQKREKS